MSRKQGPLENEFSKHPWTAVLNVIGFALYGPKAASHRVRLSQYRRRLLEHQIDLQIHVILDDEYLTYRFDGGPFPIRKTILRAHERLKLLLKINYYDVAIVQCELLPLVPSWVERALLRIPYIYDFDDAWYLRYKTGHLAKFKPILSDKIDSTIKRAAAVTAGSNYLADYARVFNSNVVVLPSAVDTTRFRKLSSTKNLVFTVGWIGSVTTEIYLEALVAPLKKFGFAQSVRLIVIGGKAPVIENTEILQIPWSEDTEIDLINTFDVGLMPLPDNEWTRGKCAFKLVQYMACGIPVIASRVSANTDLVTKDCGFLVDTEDEWIDALRWMWEHPIERKAMGLRGRKRIREAYSLSSNLPVLIEAIEKVACNK